MQEQCGEHGTVAVPLHLAAIPHIQVPLSLDDVATAFTRFRTRQQLKAIVAVKFGLASRTAR